MLGVATPQNTLKRTALPCTNAQSRRHYRKSPIVALLFSRDAHDKNLQRLLYCGIRKQPWRKWSFGQEVNEFMTPMIEIVNGLRTGQVLRDRICHYFTFLQWFRHEECTVAFWLSVQSIVWFASPSPPYLEPSRRFTMERQRNFALDKKKSVYFTTLTVHLQASANVNGSMCFQTWASDTSVTEW